MPKRASKTAFFDAARDWRAADVAAMARERPELAAARDASGRTALHVCASTETTSPGRRERGWYGVPSGCDTVPPASVTSSDPGAWSHGCERE